MTVNVTVNVPALKYVCEVPDTASVGVEPPSPKSHCQPVVELELAAPLKVTSNGTAPVPGDAVNDAVGGVGSATVTFVEPVPVRPGVPGGHLGAPHAVLSVTLKPTP